MARACLNPPKQIGSSIHIEIARLRCLLQKLFARPSSTSYILARGIHPAIIPPCHFPMQGARFGDTYPSEQFIYRRSIGALKGLCRGYGKIMCVGIWRPILILIFNKLRRTILLHFGLVTLNFHFPKNLKIPHAHDFRT